MSKPLSPEEIELCEEGLRLMRERCLEITIERNGGDRRDEGLTLLAQELGIKRQAVSSWTRVPFDQVLAVSQFTGIPPQVLHPRFRLPKRQPDRRAS